MIYVTAPTRDEARRIAETVVRERLAACANVFEGVDSYYWWQGELNEDREVALIAKTVAEKVERLIARIKELHSYTVPCVVALPILGGNRAFLDWIAAETSAEAGAKS